MAINWVHKDVQLSESYREKYNNNKKKITARDGFGNNRPRIVSFKYLVEGQAVGQFTANL